MFYLSRIEIDGFWGTFNLKTDMNKDVNIFIGKNGTGKTTLINLIQAVLTVDLTLIDRLEFDEIRIWFIYKKSSRKITVKKIITERFYNVVKYKIGQKSYEVPAIPKDFDMRRRFHPKMEEEIRELRERMRETVSVSWISVHRELIEEEYVEKYTNRKVVSKNAVDSRLKELMKKLTNYLLQLESDSSKSSEQFKKDVLMTMLYNEILDSVDEKDFVGIDLDAIKSGLANAYKDLGVKEPNVTRRIEKHILKIKESMDKLVSSKNKEIDLNDALPLALLKRTNKIVELSSALDKDKGKIFYQVNAYLRLLSKFIGNKDIYLDSKNESPLVIKKANNTFDIEELSSGEKQIIILLTETLLQRQNEFIFIADEPELSLHIEWQRKIIGAIRELNNNAQIIVATHSPEIAGPMPSKIIRMEGVISNG